MARRRSGLMALRAALGAVGGGLQGYAEMQEQARERARRDALDAAAFAERGWMAPEARESQLKQAAPGLQSALASAASMMGGGAPRALDMASLQQGAGMYGPPAGEITIGGRKLVLPETGTKRQERLAEFERGEERRKTQEERDYRRTTQQETQQQQVDALIAVGRTPEQARAEVLSGYRTPEPEWKQAGYASEKEWLTSLGRRAAVVRAPERTPTSKDLNLAIDEATIKFRSTPIEGPGGIKEFPTKDQVAQFRNELRSALFGDTTTSPEPEAPVQSLSSNQANPFASITPEEAQASGIDLTQYRSDPAYRRWVDSKRGR